MASELWVLWATVAILLLYYLTSLHRPSGKGRLPPGPRPLPVIGNLLDLGGNLHHTLASLARVHGPVMRIRLGLTTAVLVSSPDAARDAFTRHDRRLAARDIPDSARVPGPLERSMIWLPSADPRWKSQRGIVATHVISPRTLEAARAVRERKVRDLVGYIRGRAGRELDVAHAVYGGLLNLVSTAFFSVDVADLGTQSALGLQALMKDIIELPSMANVSDLFPLLRPLDLQGRRRHATKLYEKIFRLFDDIIDRRLAEKCARSDSDFLDALLQLTSTGTITRDDVKAIMFDVFTAGSDTMAMTVVWAMAELLGNPGAMAKVRAEIQETLGGKEAIEEPDAAGLPYLQAVVKEAMRLHPVGPLILPQMAVEDGVEIGGYEVPKGCTVIFNVWAIMRHPAAWERPDEFVPERWFQDKAAEMDSRGKAYEFLPFGSGRRLCPGIPMAERVVPFMLASLLHAFEWKLPNDMPAEQLDLSEKFTTANVMAVPLKAVPTVII